MPVNQLFTNLHKQFQTFSDTFFHQKSLKNRVFMPKNAPKNAVFGSFLSKIRQKHIVFTQKTRVKQAVFAEKLPVVVQYSIPNHQKISAASLDLSKESSQNLPYFIVSILRSFLAEY